MTMYGFLKKYEMYREVVQKLYCTEPCTAMYEEVSGMRVELEDEIYEGLRFKHNAEMVVSYIFDSDEHDFNRECPQTWLLEFRASDRNNRVCKLASEVYSIWDKMRSIESSPHSTDSWPEYEKLTMDSCSLAGLNGMRLKNLILEDNTARSFVADWLCDCAYMPNAPDLEPQFEFLLEALQYK